jgi:hypothetical protein
MILAFSLFSCIEKTKPEIVKSNNIHDEDTITNKPDIDEFDPSNVKCEDGLTPYQIDILCR